MKWQEHVRKDIERFFGVLVKKFGILKHHLRGWYSSDIKQVVDCCVIIHNMTQEVQMTDYTFKDQMESENNNEEEEEVQSIFFNEENQVGDNIEHALHTRVAHMCSVLEDSTKHIQLRDDLMEHIMRRH